MKNIFTKALILCLGLITLAPVSLHASRPSLLGQPNAWYSLGAIFGITSLGFGCYYYKNRNVLSANKKAATDTKEIAQQRLTTIDEACNKFDRDICCHEEISTDLAQKAFEATHEHQILSKTKYYAEINHYNRDVKNENVRYTPIANGPMYNLVFSSIKSAKQDYELRIKDAQQIIQRPLQLRWTIGGLAAASAGCFAVGLGLSKFGVQNLNK